MKWKPTQSQIIITITIGIALLIFFGRYFPLQSMVHVESGTPPISFKEIPNTIWYITAGMTAFFLYKLIKGKKK